MRGWVVAAAAAVTVVGCVLAAEIVAPGLLPWSTGLAAGVRADAETMPSTGQDAAAAEGREGDELAFADEPPTADAPSAEASTIGGAEADPDGDDATASDADADEASAGDESTADEPTADEIDAEAADDDERAEGRRADSRAAAGRARQAQGSRSPPPRARDAREDERSPASADPGFLTLDAKPYATIVIAGQEIGDTPIVRHELPPGEHVVEVRFSTGEVKRVRLAVESGGVVRRRITP